ncbi:MAG: hypothetical protein QG646_1394 [Euryarchaeota archaeon]|nr:hypothetical protein [Euryarchaeota archaeon]
MLKKWLILAIVLSCTIFAVSSGCSEKGNGNTTQGTVEKSKENVTEGVTQNSNLNASTDKTTGGSESSSSDSGKETKMKIESTDSSGAKTETNIVSTGNSDDWCQVGSSWSTVNPQTGETANMKITGIETVDGVPMCKAVYESNTKDNDYAKLEYFWSQDNKVTLWNAYDVSGKKVSEVSMKDGKMRMVDKDGKVTEITTSS